MTNKSVIPIVAFEYGSGKLFFSSSVSEQKRLVYYTTVYPLLLKLFKSSVSVNSSFTNRPGRFAEIRSKNKAATYCTTATLQHQSWYVQINNKKLIKQPFVNMVTEKMIGGRPEIRTGKPLKKSRVNFFNLMVYVIIPAVALLWGLFLFFLIRALLS